MDLFHSCDIGANFNTTLNSA